MKRPLPLAVLLAFVLTAPALGETPQEQYDRAAKLMAGSRYDESRELYQQALPHLAGEQAVNAQFKIAYALQRVGQYAEAVEAYEKVIANPEADAGRVGASWMGIGYCHQVRSSFEQALEAYRKAAAVEDAPVNLLAEVTMRAGYTLSKLERPDDAVAEFEKLVELPCNPAHHQAALTAAGGIRQAQLRYGDALELYERGLAIAPQSSAGEVLINRIAECRTALHAEPEFFFAPYVSLVSPTAAAIFWASLEGVPPGSVTVRRAGASDDAGQTIKADAALTKMADRDAYRQMVTLSDLEPYTLYTYEAISGGKTASGVFHTARDKPGPVRFVVLGDTQTGWQHHEKLAPRIAAEEPDFVLHVGDCVERGDRWDEWKVQVFDPARPYLQKAPIWVARGNHDGGPYFNIIFGRENAPYQTFTFANFQLFILDSTYYFGGSRGTEQLAWLEQQLGSSDAQWQMVAQHHPMFHTANGDRLVGQDNFRPLIEAMAPDIVINGHYHVYTRLLPIGSDDKKPLINIVTGGGGGRTSSLTTITPIAQREVGGIHHYCLFEIDGDKLTMTAKSIDGEMLDQFTLVKKDGRFQDEVMAKTIAPDVARAVHMLYHDLQAPTHNRHDLTAQLDPAGEGDEYLVQLDRNLLKFDALPKDVRLIVESGTDSGWQVERQVLKVADGELTFRATPPTDDAGAHDTKAPLAVTLTAQAGERLLEPRELVVSLRQPAAVAR